MMAVWRRHSPPTDRMFSPQARQMAGVKVSPAGEPLRSPRNGAERPLRRQMACYPGLNIKPVQLPREPRPAGRMAGRARRRAGGHNCEVRVYPERSRGEEGFGFNKPALRRESDVAGATDAGGRIYRQKTHTFSGGGDCPPPTKPPYEFDLLPPRGTAASRAARGGRRRTCAPGADAADAADRRRERGKPRPSRVRAYARACARLSLDTLVISRN